MKKDKRTVGQEIVASLRSINKAIADGKSVSELFTCNRVILHLQPREYNPEMVKATRKMLRVSQGLFAQFIGVSSSTVKAWEQGVHPVPGVACRFMDEINLDKKHFLKRLRESVVDKQIA